MLDAKLIAKCRDYGRRYAAWATANPDDPSVLRSLGEAAKDPHKMMLSKGGECQFCLTMGFDPHVCVNWAVGAGQASGVDVYFLHKGTLITADVKQSAHNPVQYLFTSVRSKLHLPGDYGPDIFVLVRLAGSIDRDDWEGETLRWVWRHKYIKQHRTKTVGDDLPEAITLKTPYMRRLDMEVMSRLWDDVVGVPYSKGPGLLAARKVSA